ncbi:aminopeptidase N-like [Nylanderia fulva]|uniref:aminopeptidase N-like n=1 Tax=Nylanderia fulva TaxID=613905 RepID=UPI0010FB91B1|nr:aminopeptidase N-like [Nylanderia fulva]
MDLFVVQNQHNLFFLDGDYHIWNSPLQDDKSLLKIRESIRAPFILRMMLHAFTEEIFWKTVRTHYVFSKYAQKRKLNLSLGFKENDWMIFNLQQIGYYRVNYDLWNWRKISYYLNFDNYTKIHVLNRAQIIDNAFHLMIGGQLLSYVFWDIIRYMHREEDYIAWYPMFKVLEYLSSAFIVLEENIEKFTGTISDILKNVLKKIKYKEIDDTDKLRNFTTRITCKKKANKKLKQHLQDPTKHKLLPWWKEWTYCKGLIITTKNETWELMHTKGLEKSDTKFFEYLACPEDINLIKKYLDDIRYKQYNSTEQKYQYHSYGFLHIITKHAKNQIILEYILDHFNEIRPKNVHLTAALIIIINNVYLENQTQQILNKDEYFIETNLVEMNNTEDRFKRHHIKEMSDTVIDKDYFYYKYKQKILSRNNEIKRQKQYLKNFFY